MGIVLTRGPDRNGGAKSSVMETVVAVSFPVGIRHCTRDDLDELEWFGLFTKHRRIIRAAFRKQTRNEGVMLVAEGNGHLVGQVWIDFTRFARRRAAFLWAFRVVPWLQGMRIGSVLLSAAEQEILARGFQYSEVSVDTDNLSARSIYEHYGYVFACFGDSAVIKGSTGRKRRQPRWILRKEISVEVDQFPGREASAA